MLDHVLQFPHVPFPGTAPERAHGGLGVFRQWERRPAVARPVPREEEVREERNVGWSLAQRRHVDRHHPQAVVEVLAQCSLGHGIFRIAIRGCDEPHVDHGVGVLAAHPTHHAVLNHAQKLCLDRLRHIGQLVQLQGSAIGRLQQPGLVAHRAGKRALDVSEHFRFQQHLG